MLIGSQRRGVGCPSLFVSTPHGLASFSYFIVFVFFCKQSLEDVAIAASECVFLYLYLYEYI